MNLIFLRKHKCFWVSLFLTIFNWINLQAHAEGLNCVILLEGSHKWESANEQCLATNKIDEAKFENVTLNMTLEEYDLDDNCFIQCVYSKVGILTPEGALDKKQTVNIFKGNMTDEMNQKTTAIWDNCIDEADKIAKTRNADPCKRLGLHDFCFNKMVMEQGILEMEC